MMDGIREQTEEENSIDWSVIEKRQNKDNQGYRQREYHRQRDKCLRLLKTQLLTQHTH